MPDWAKAAALTMPRVNASDSGAPVSAQTVCCAPSARRMVVCKQEPIPRGKYVGYNCLTP
jgi:hypothetical protein